MRYWREVREDVYETIALARAQLVIIDKEIQTLQAPALARAARWERERLREAVERLEKNLKEDGQ